MPLGTAHLAQVVIKGKYDGQDYRNILHFGSDIDVNDGNRNALLLALATAVLDCLINMFMPNSPGNFTVQSVSAKEVYPGTSDEVEAFPGVGQAATGEGGAGLPGFAATVVAIKTGKGGRTKRGRLFLPPPDEANADAGLTSATWQGTVAQFLACMAGKFIGAGKTEDWELGVLSRKGMGSASDYPNATFTPAIALTQRPEIGVMRRRKLSHGT